MGNITKIKSWSVKIILILATFYCREVKYDKKPSSNYSSYIKKYPYSTMNTFDDEIALHGNKRTRYMLSEISCFGSICKYVRTHRLRCYNDAIFLVNSYNESEYDKNKVIKKIIGEEIDKVSGEVRYRGGVKCNAGKNTPIISIKKILYWDQKIQTMIESEFGRIKFTSKINLEDTMSIKITTFSSEGNNYYELDTYQNLLIESKRKRQKILSCKGTICKYIKSEHFHFFESQVEGAVYNPAYYYVTNEFVQKEEDKDKIVKIIYGKVIDTASGEVITPTNKHKFDNEPIISIQKIEYWNDAIRLKIESDRELEK